ncbi:hypothetical protein VNO80_25151 [Phaseolus coccineus]|uniref:Uncharacterized protein n=1 Tax=Phaseolus coccineus TaxID=3886 RepID=A0AAN9LU31_PHACN
MITGCKIYDQVNNKGGDQEDFNNDQDVNNGDLVSLKELVDLMDEKISHDGDEKEDKKDEPEEDDESNDLSLLEGSFDSVINLMVKDLKFYLLDDLMVEEAWYENWKHDTYFSQEQDLAMGFSSF